jgi:hypothetical protein
LGIKEPDKLTRKEYYQAYADYLFLQKNKREFLVNILRQVVNEAFGGEQEL